MSDLTLPRPMLTEPLRRDWRIVWTALASVMLHAGVLAFLLWQPLPEIAEAAQPPSIEVELVQPPEASASEPPTSEEAASEDASSASAAAIAPSAGTTSAEQPPEPAEAPAPSAAEPPAEEATSPTETAETASEASAAAALLAPEAPASAAPQEPSGSEVPEGSVDPTKVAPIPLSRPKVRGLTAPSDAPDEAASALATDAGENVTGTNPAAVPAEPDVASLALGEPRSAERFYLEAMLSAPTMARVREVLQTLPPEKRLAQTCNIEALAQIGNAGEGFAPDVVMAEAYALSETTGTRLVADGGIFRSQDKWYGVAFDCTLSDDLTTVTAFSYRLGADVTEAVLARLGKT
jgi:cytoskeletal protein RodZ